MRSDKRACGQIIIMLKIKILGVLVVLGLVTFPVCSLRTKMTDTSLGADFFEMQEVSMGRILRMITTCMAWKKKMSTRLMTSTKTSRQWMKAKKTLCLSKRMTKMTSSVTLLMTILIQMSKQRFFLDARRATRYAGDPVLKDAVNPATIVALVSEDAAFALERTPRNSLNDTQTRIKKDYINHSFFLSPPPTHYICYLSLHSLFWKLNLVDRIYLQI